MEGAQQSRIAQNGWAWTSTSKKKPLLTALRSGQNIIFSFKHTAERINIKLIKVLNLQKSILFPIQICIPYKYIASHCSVTKLKLKKITIP